MQLITYHEYYDLERLASTLISYGIRACQVTTVDVRLAATGLYYTISIIKELQCTMLSSLETK